MSERQTSLDEHPAVTGWRESLLLPALVVAVLTYSMAQGMVVPALPEIAEAFDATFTETTWVLSANLVMTALCLTLVGRFGDLYGRRRVLLVALAVFLVGTLAAVLAPSLGLLIGARIVLGVGGGIFAVSFGLAREWLRPNRRMRAIGIIAISVGFGGMLGIPVGGLLLSLAGYQAVFWSNALMAVVSLAAIAIVVPRHGQRSPATLDVGGTIALAFVVSLPLIALARTTRSAGADVIVLLMIGLAVLAGLVFVRIERRAIAPVIDIATALQRVMIVTNSVTFLTGLGSFAVMVQISLMAQAQGAGLDATAFQSGLLLLPGSLAMLLIAGFAGRLTSAVGSRQVLALGSAISALGFVLLAVWHADAAALASGVAVVFAGVALSNAAAATIVVAAVPLGQTGEVTGVNGMFRIFGSAIGAPVAVAIMMQGSSEGPTLTNSSVTEAFVASGLIMLIAAGIAFLLRRTAGVAVAP